MLICLSIFVVLHVNELTPGNFYGNYFKAQCVHLPTQSSILSLASHSYQTLHTASLRFLNKHEHKHAVQNVWRQERVFTQSRKFTLLAHAQDDSCPLRQHDAIPSEHTLRTVFHSQSAEQADILSYMTSTITQQN